MLSKKVASLKSSPTLALAAKAKELADQGEDVVSLAVGEPDWPTVESAAQAGVEAIQRGETKYLSAAGLIELRQTIAEQTSSDMNLSWEGNSVSVTPGAKFSLYAALQSLIDPGDEVVVPKPYWVSYPTLVQLAGGVVRFAETSAETCFKLTPEALRESLNEKSKVLMMNSPSNPSGQVYSLEELEALGEVLRNFPKVIILSDDIYNRLVFEEDGVAPHILHVCPDLKERCLLINGVSKSYAMTGWRIGWSVGPNELVAAMARYQSQALGASCSISQWAAREAILNGKSDLELVKKKLSERLNYTHKALNTIDGIECDKPGGAFYVLPKIQSFLGKKYKGKTLSDSRDFCNALLEEQKVVTVSGADFGLEGYMRLSYALEIERMQEAVRRISQFVSGLE